MEKEGKGGKLGENGEEKRKTKSAFPGMAKIPKGSSSTKPEGALRS